MAVSSILNDLNPEQQVAATFWGKPLLILAGAGSGKTRTLTVRAAWLIQEKGIPPENLLLLTFTNKAAGEMRDRITKLLSSATLFSALSTHYPFAGTFHSFCARVLRETGHFLGIPNNFVIYDTNDQKELVKEAIQKLGLENSVKPQVALAEISQAKNELVNPLEYAGYVRGEWQKKVAQIYLEYQKLLKRNDALDFDDLLVQIVHLFKNYKDVLTKYRNRFQYILVDEWQDTNKAQYEITKMLASRDRNLTVVGDASQSIYGWRGADYRNITNLQRDFPELTTINLKRNYRSTQNILDAAYGVISKNKNHPILELWTENPKGERIKLYQARSELDEAAFIVNQVNQLIGEVTYSDFAVLYRTNAQSRVLEEAFLHQGIPYVLVGNVSFYERREIKDILSYLRLIANSKDSVSRKRAEKLGKKRLIKFEEIAERLNPEKHTTLEVLDEILEKTGYLELYDKKNEEDLIRLENIKELRSVATEFPTLTQFLEQVALVEAAQDARGKILLASQEGNGGAVTLMTAHAAKGLEFSIVFITGLEEGLFPHSRSLFDSEQLEEERRLAYVGITRAKQKLYLTFASRRLIFGQRGSNLPSRFLSEIPENLLEGEAPRDSLDDISDFTETEFEKW
ncbi:MAG: UvrD-helicase domain-containing protein [bacterium]|nr:UvrD-helicase domain-containing protein [bacterium]